MDDGKIPDNAKQEIVPKEKTKRSCFSFKDRTPVAPVPSRFGHVSAKGETIDHQAKKKEDIVDAVPAQRAQPQEVGCPEFPNCHCVECQRAHWEAHEEGEASEEVPAEK